MAGAVMITTIVALVLLAPVSGRYSPVGQDSCHTSGPERASLAGNRRAWPRHVVTPVVRRAHRPASRRARGDLPFCFGVFIRHRCAATRGRLDSTVMRIVDVVLAFPFYVLIIALVFFVGVGTHGIYIAFALTIGCLRPDDEKRDDGRRTLDWVPRGRWRPFESPCAVRHILPNTVTQAIVYSMSDIVIVILAVVTLGYLGLGSSLPPDWGSIDHRPARTSSRPTSGWPSCREWPSCFTGIACRLLADGLADILRPDDSHLGGRGARRPRMRRHGCGIFEQ